jgi:hypothetical protein
VQCVRPNTPLIAGWYGKVDNSDESAILLYLFPYFQGSKQTKQRMRFNRKGGGDLEIALCRVFDYWG